MRNRYSQNDFEGGAEDGDEGHLRDAVAGPDGDGLFAQIDGGDLDLPAVVGVDHAHAVREREALPDSETAAGEDERGDGAVGCAEVHGESGGDEGALAGFEGQRRVEGGAEVARGGGGTLVRRDARIRAEFFQLHGEGHRVGLLLGKVFYRGCAASSACGLSCGPRTLVRGTD